MQVYVDMDGVLADFDQGHHDRFGVWPSKVSDNVDWDRIRHTPDFYLSLPPMHDMDELWKGLELRCVRPPIVLTGVPANVPGAYENKRAFVDRYLGRDVTVIGCKSREKSKFMSAAGDVLIDDWEKYKQLWIDAGGRWITHTGARKSLDQLDDILAGW
jgi:hypothetical protein